MRVAGWGAARWAYVALLELPVDSVPAIGEITYAALIDMRAWFASILEWSMRAP